MTQEAAQAHRVEAQVLGLHIRVQVELRLQSQVLFRSAAVGVEGDADGGDTVPAEGAGLEIELVDDDGLVTDASMADAYAGKLRQRRADVPAARLRCRGLRYP